MRMKLSRFSFVGDEVFQDVLRNGSIILRTIDLFDYL